MSLYYRIFCVLFISGWLTPPLLAQPETCYTLSLSEHFMEEVSLPDFHSCLSYQDRYGTDEHLTLTFTNQYGRRVGQYRMPKGFGSNQHPLDLRSVGVILTDSPYLLSFTDEWGTSCHIPFRVVVSEAPAPTVHIEADALSLDCASSEGNVVNYYGKVQGGKAPYEAVWRVLDSSGRELYQPRTDQLSKKGRTPMVVVESRPTYYVLLEVRDACGETAQQVVNVQCNGDLEKSNTLFVKPIRPKQQAAP